MTLILPLVPNVAILGVILTLFALDSGALSGPYGPDTPARRILICVYGTIALASVVLIALHLRATPSARPWTQMLLVLQITYKLGTVALIGLGNPVVVSNLIIALAYAAALALG